MKSLRSISNYKIKTHDTTCHPIHRAVLVTVSAKHICNKEAGFVTKEIWVCGLISTLTTHTRTETHALICVNGVT